MIAMVEDMERRLKSQCMGLLEIFEPVTTVVGADQGKTFRLTCRPDDDDNKSSNWLHPQALKVRYLHRTTRDFLRSARVWKSIIETTGSDFDANERWAYGFLWSLKTLQPELSLSRSGQSTSNLLKLTNPRPSSKKWRMWDPLTWCMEYALRVQQCKGKVPFELLDELGRAAIDSRPEIWASQQVVLPHAFVDTPPKSFLDIAVVFGLDDYARMRLTKASRSEAKHALMFSKEHNDLFLNHRKDYWLRDRSALRQAFGSTTLHGELRSHSVFPVHKLFRLSGSR